MKNRNITLYIDLVFCLGVLPLLILLLPVERWLSIHPLFVVSLVLWLYAVYFINRKIAMPLVFTGKKYWAAALIAVAMIVVTYILSKYDFKPDFKFREAPDWVKEGAAPKGPAQDGVAPQVRFPERESRTFFRLRMHEQAAWFLFCVVYAFSVAVGLLTQLFRQGMEKKELEMERNKAELALYKAQINPHFMFNTLNTLYGLVITKSDKAEHAFNQFIAMVKYMYANGTRDFIPLDEEEQYIRQYIDLQKLRLNEHTRVRFDYDHDGRAHEIAPMLLITFVENAFKYGVSSHEDTGIVIELSAKGSEIRFAVANSIMRNGGQTKGDGIGLANCRKRLALLYPGAHRLNVSQTGDRFQVELEIFES